MLLLIIIIITQISLLKNREINQEENTVEKYLFNNDIMSSKTAMRRKQNF